MDQNTAALLGMVKMKHPAAPTTELVEVRGFDVLGFFFPFIRLLAGGMIGLAALFFCGGFLIYPVWSWYLGFNYKKMRFEKMLKEGWTVVKEDHKAA